MKYCGTCGRKLNDEDNACSHCGAFNICEETKPEKKKVDCFHFGLAVLGFFIPMAGLLFYLLRKDEMPLRARSAAWGAFFGSIHAVVVPVILAYVYVGLYFTIFLLAAVLGAL